MAETKFTIFYFGPSQYRTGYKYEAHCQEIGFHFVREVDSYDEQAAAQDILANLPEGPKEFPLFDEEDAPISASLSRAVAALALAEGKQ